MSNKDLIIKVLNCFEVGKAETNYSSVYLYHDGPNNSLQVTVGRGYTEEGTLWKVFECYKALGGKYADRLLSYKSQQGKETLPKNKEFINLLTSLGKSDELFRQAQDDAFDTVYWMPAYEWFLRNNFTTNLSLAVIEDSKLHSGGMLKFLMNKFSEKKPIDGGDEKKWISAYVTARRKWLAASKDPLCNTTYRMDFFIREMGRSNWELALPLYPNGIKLS